MQDGFLFNDDDPKQRGVGCDALCPDDKRLKFKWTWNPFLGKDKPSQVSEVKLENNWELEVTFWHKYYEACVNCRGELIKTYRVEIDDEFFKGWIPLLTRLDAQLKAEEMFIELGEDIVRQCK